jgi:PAS domain S-box-containing protein
MTISGPRAKQPISSSLTDLEGRIIDANDAFLRILGYDREVLVSGLRWPSLTPAELHASDQRTLAELKATGTVRPCEREYFRKDGSRVPVLMGSTLFEESGNEGLAFVLDLTARKCAEEALRASEYKLRQIIEAVPSLLWSADPNGEPTHINQRMLDYSGMRFFSSKVAGTRSCTPTTFRKLQGLSLTQFRPALRTSA